MTKRRLGRELGLRILFSWESHRNEIVKYTDSFLQQLPYGKNEVQLFSKRLVYGVHRNMQKIDELISGYLKNWDFERINPIDRNIIRIAVYEHLFEDDIPKNVSIDEAVEIAKKFGTEDSPGFVNAILDKIMKENIGRKLN